jgi:hypothetical protein
MRPYPKIMTELLSQGVCLEYAILFSVSYIQYVKQFSEDVYSMVCCFLKEQLKRMENSLDKLLFKFGKAVSEMHGIIAFEEHASAKAQFTRCKKISMEDEKCGWLYPNKMDKNISYQK